MRHYTEQIIKFAENPDNWPKRTFKRMSRQPNEICGDISRFIYSNQNVIMNLSKEIVQKNQQNIQIIPEMDSDIRENQTYYDEGVAFCEFDCFQNKLFLTENIYNSLLQTTQTAVQCMIYASELADDDVRAVLSKLTVDVVDFSPKIPHFDRTLSSTFVMSEFETSRYYADHLFENHNCNKFDRHQTDITFQKACVLFINLPFEVYSECLNNMHHLNYNINHHEFMCLRKSREDFSNIITDIEQNGLQVPLTFELIGHNIAPIENSSRILMAILLKIPFILACVVAPDVKYSFNNMYFHSKNTKEKMNKIFYPYYYFF